MKRDRSTPGLEALYARLDQIRMSQADRLNARAALAQRLRVKATLKITFTPYGGSPSSRIVEVRLKR